MRRKFFWLVLGGFTAGLGGALLWIRQPTEPLTLASLAEARGRWLECQIADYDASYLMFESVYDASIRDGIVVDLKVNGVAVTSTDWRSYSMDGLLEMLAVELEHSTNPGGPFGPAAKDVLMRVRFHPKHGYVERYVRGAIGGNPGVSLELVGFNRRTAGAPIH